jgi:1-acyl-sn-glycerol-3-phosphate acyltransferase
VTAREPRHAARAGARAGARANARPKSPQATADKRGQQGATASSPSAGASKARAAARASARKREASSAEHDATGAERIGVDASSPATTPALDGEPSVHAVQEALESFDPRVGHLLAQSVPEESVSQPSSTRDPQAAFGIVDDFGRAPMTYARIQPLLDWLYKSYFRVRVEGIENIPSEGPAMLVCNHGGALPWDGVMLATALMREHPAKRSLRWLVEDFAFHAPFVGPLLNRIGAVRACPENAERLLAEGHVLAVFPEGVQGIGKPYAQRYRLQRFGRGGHVKLALRAGVPMIPVGIAGSDDIYPLLYKVRAFSKVLGVPFIPITPLFPLLGPLGLAPLPSRFHIAVGAPLEGLSALAPETADDTLAVHDINDRVRRAVQQLLDRALAARGPHTFR